MFDFLCSTPSYNNQIIFLHLNSHEFWPPKHDNRGLCICSIILLLYCYHNPHMCHDKIRIKPKSNYQEVSDKTFECVLIRIQIHILK